MASLFSLPLKTGLEHLDGEGTPVDVVDLGFRGVCSIHVPGEVILACSGLFWAFALSLSLSSVVYFTTTMRCMGPMLGCCGTSSTSSSTMVQWETILLLLGAILLARSSFTDSGSSGSSTTAAKQTTARNIHTRTNRQKVGL